MNLKPFISAWREFCAQPATRDEFGLSGSPASARNVIRRHKAELLRLGIMRKPAAGRTLQLDCDRFPDLALFLRGHTVDEILTRAVAKEVSR